MKLKYIIIILAVLLGNVSDLCSQEKRLKKADEIYESEEYYRAAKAYTKSLRKIKNKSQKSEVHFKIGESLFLINNYRKARNNFKQSAKNRNLEIISKIRLAEIEIQEGNFELAVNYYNEVLKISPGDSTAIKGIESVNLALEWKDKPSRYIIEPARHLNSKRNDFSPSVDEKSGYDHIYFSSTRDNVKGKKLSNVSGERYSDLFISKFEKKQKWTDPESLDSLNTAYDEGAPCVFDEGRKLYYTTCLSEKGRKIGCQIYEASKVDGIWMNPVNLNIVPDSVSIGHPAVSPDGNTVYFAARMDGGFGGSDIWCSEKTDDGWSKPKNMGPAINSSGDELFPFMRADTTLYYSSTKAPTMGGLDIFYAYKNEEGKWVSENMKPPFNSNGNDFGIYIYAKEDKGYFTSDRRGSRGEDIYYFEKTPLIFNLEGFIKDKDEMHFIDSAVVTLYGSDGTMFKDTFMVGKNRNPKFTFNLKPKTDYVFVVTKDGYFNGKSRLTTDSLEFNKDFKYEILLESFNKTFEIPNIEFEFGKWELTPIAKHTLDSVTRIMVDNPYLIIELSAHTDMVGSDESNMELSQKRANSVTLYLESKGIPRGRLVAKGYGESMPKVITIEDFRYPFLPKGAILNEEFVKGLTQEQQIVANQQNRRIEMRVIGNDYVPDLDW